MQLAIIYDSRTGTTRAAAEAMGRLAGDAGHRWVTKSVHDAAPNEVSAADAVCIGSWTEGLFFFGQHATKDTMKLIDRLSLHGQPAAVFCTYKTSPGKMLQKMAEAMEASGGSVTAQLRSRGPEAPQGFAEWLQSLPRE